MSEATNPFVPDCYFCDGGVLSLNRPIVRAADESPDEAQRRPVCEDCDPKRGDE
jgi:hypothetical protein